MANGHGGARPRAGRRTTADILGLAELIDAAWPEAKQKAVIKQLATDCTDKDFHTRHEARKLLLAYKFGRPTEKHEHLGKDGKDLIPPKFVVEILNGSNRTNKKNTDK